MNLPEVTLNSLNESAHKYRSDLIKIPVLGMDSSLKFMTVRYGVRGDETVYDANFKSEFQNYGVAERKNVMGDYIPRTLTTHFAANFFNFDPNEVIKSIFGHRAAQAGEGVKTTIVAKDVAASVMKNAGASLNKNLFKAAYKATGKTSKDLFDGYDTITEKEIAAGNISEAKGNLVVLTEAIDDTNAVHLLKKVMRKATPELRLEDCFIFCDQEIVDDYEENYLLTHQAVPYNTEYNQPTLEGTGKRWAFAGLVGKTGSKFIHICPKSNMLFGVDQMSDQERVEFHKYEPKVLTGEIYAFFGAQFESIAPERMLVVQLADGTNDAEEPEESPKQEEGEGENP